MTSVEAIQASESLQDLLFHSGQKAAGDEQGAGAISKVMSARLTKDDQQVLVVDASPPLLKTFNSDGRLISAAIARGGGPDELEGATNIAVSATSAVFIARGSVHIRRLSDGAQHPGRLPHQFFDLGYDCSDRLIGYGPDRASPSRFIHILTGDTTLTVSASALGADRPARIGWPRSVMGTRDGSLISHRGDSRVDLVYIDCTGTVTQRSWDWAVSGFPSQVASRVKMESQRKTEGGTVVTSVIDITEPLFIGAGDIDGRLLWMETRSVAPEAKRSSLDDYVYRTYFYLADSVDVRGAYVTGDFRLQDISDRSVLLSTNDPWPQVLVVDREALVMILEKVNVVLSRRPGA